MADPISGAVSIIGGLFSFGARKKAKKYANRAAAVERQQAQLEAAVQRRDLVRQSRIARAQAVAASASESGGLQSSAPQGAIGSVGSQTISNLSYFDRQVGMGNEAQAYRQKAGKYASRAENIDAITGILSGAVGLFSGGSASGSTGLTKSVVSPVNQSFSKYSPWLPTQTSGSGAYGNKIPSSTIKYLGK